VPAQRDQSPWKCPGTSEVSHTGTVGDTGCPGAAVEAGEDTQGHLRWLEMPEPFSTGEVWLSAMTEEKEVTLVVTCWRGRPV